MKQASALYRLLGDEARLRLLRVLARERLNVTELTGILGLAQSGVSRHLGLLKDAGLVAEERDGGFTYYRLAPGARSDDGQRAALGGCSRQQFAASADDPAVRADEARLQEVLRLRKENFEHARRRRHARRAAARAGRSWAAWSRALGLLLPPLDVADLGCGEGYLTIEAARWARASIAVDRSADVLERAQGAGRAAAASSNITWKRGELEKLPIEDASGRRRAAVAGAAPRGRIRRAPSPKRRGSCARRPRAGPRSARSTTRSGCARKLGDRWLGFSDDELQAHADRRRAARRARRRRRAQDRRSVHGADCVAARSRRRTRSTNAR